MAQVQDPHQGQPDSHSYGSSLFVSQEFDTLPEAPIKPGLVEQWRENNRTLAFQFSPVSNDGAAWITPVDYKHELERDSGVPILPQESKIFFSSIPGLSYTPEYLRFVAESFPFLQKIVEINISMNRGDIDVRREMRWNEGISEFIEEYIQLINSSSENNQRLADVNNIVRCFNAIRFQPDSKNNIASLFAEWVNCADENPNTEALEQIMMGKSNPADNYMYWNMLYSATIRNLTELCVNMLEPIAQYYQGENSKLMIQNAISLLREYPKDSDMFTLRVWKHNVAELIKTLQTVEDRNLQMKLQTFFSILHGDRDVILKRSTSWFEAMCGLLCYTDPTRKRLDEYYVQCVEYHPVDQTLAWEEGCSSVINGSFLDAIEKIESLDPFVATVISETCEAKGLMDIYLNESFTNVRNWLLINFAKLCLDVSSLAPAGVQLLVMIRTDEAKAIFAEYVPRLVFIRPEEVEIAINTAMDFGLEDTVKTIHRTTARRLEAEGAYLEAMVHLDQIQDKDGLRTLAWKLFEECLVRGEPLDDDVLEDAVNSKSLEFDISPVVRESLAPYAVLAKALTYLRNGSSIAAAKHFAALFRFPYIPVKYYSVLFLSMDLLLKRQQPRVFSISELTDVMRAIDKWEEAAVKSESIQKEIKDLMAMTLRAVDVPGKKVDESREFDIDLVLKNTRKKLAKEISRAYMENA